MFLSKKHYFQYIKTVPFLQWENKKILKSPKVALLRPYLDCLVNVHIKLLLNIYVDKFDEYHMSSYPKIILIIIFSPKIPIWGPNSLELYKNQDYITLFPWVNGFNQFGKIYHMSTWPKASKNDIFWIQKMSFLIQK